MAGYRRLLQTSCGRLEQPLTFRLPSCRIAQQRMATQEVFATADRRLVAAKKVGKDHSIRTRLGSFLRCILHLAVRLQMEGRAFCRNVPIGASRSETLRGATSLSNRRAPESEGLARPDADALPIRVRTCHRRRPPSRIWSSIRRSGGRPAERWKRTATPSSSLPRTASRRARRSIPAL